ncbi:putative signal transducing protein [Nonlabens antarcticus]|uniref:putative signal transducing protein n=1 Tax=Nonlabens antarcticus TaxID=392714 RepID=UPI001890CCA8|nr:DUF2007 domain-containing protein [Nonlabens antarcticus]
MEEYTKIYAGSSITISRLADLLDQENISSIIKDNVESGRLAGFGTSGDSVDLYVLNTHLPKAEKVLSNFESAE